MKYQFAALIIAYAGSFAYIYHRYNDHLPLKKYLTNHVLLFSPLNLLFTYFTVGEQKAIFATTAVPGLDKIRDNYPLIREEAKALVDAGVFRRKQSVDQPGFNTFEKGGYRTHFLKWYTKKCGHAAAKMSPKTCAIIDSIPAIRCAMFAVLPPGGRIGRHHDPVATSLRYHLGLLTPNSEKCALTLDGVEYPWRDGEELLFDQTYVHSAVNNTETLRVILFCDVEKTHLRAFMKPIADAVDYGLVARLTGADDHGKRSWISTAYMPIYQLRSYVKEKVKPRSLLAYNILKFGCIGLLLFVLYSLM
jgi:beta-hydroxylase